MTSCCRTRRGPAFLLMSTTKRRPASEVHVPTSAPSNGPGLLSAAAAGHWQRSPPSHGPALTATHLYGRGAVGCAAALAASRFPLPSAAASARASSASAPLAYTCTRQLSGLVSSGCTIWLPVSCVSVCCRVSVHICLDTSSHSFDPAETHPRYPTNKTQVRLVLQRAVAKHHS